MDHVHYFNSGKAMFGCESSRNYQRYAVISISANKEKVTCVTCRMNLEKR